jgi:3-methyladenine DNA glycosylase/8-oxoguanine DNA glycosylase
MHAFLAARAIPGVERVEGDAYLRTISTPGGPSVLEVRPAADGPALELRLDPPRPSARSEAVSRARRMFDLDVDPTAVAGALGRDPLLGGSVRSRAGLRVPGGWDAFEVLVRAVLGQQVSIAAAARIAGRLAAAFGERLPAPRAAGPTLVFPAPAALAGADPAALPMTRARGSALVVLASAAARGELALVGRGDLEASLAALRGLPGVGRWTAQIVAMRAFRERDAFPAGDLALRRALGLPGAPLGEAETLARAESWRPWRAYAAQHLWAMDAERRP